MIFKRKNRKTYDPFVIQETGGKTKRLEGFSYRKSWTEDSFIPDSPQKETVGRTFSFSKLRPISLVIMVLIFILIGRVAWLQIVKGDYYYSMAEGNRIRIKRVEAKRGIIYDRNHNPLVRNEANFLLYFIPADLPKEEKEKNEIIEQVSGISGRASSQEIREELGKIKPGSLESFQPLFIADNIEYEKAMLLYLKADLMPGVFLSNKTRREYNLYCQSLSHILGYTGKINQEELLKFGQEYWPIDYIGKTGIEYFWENELKGLNGKEQIEVDAMGKEKKVVDAMDAEDGHNLLLSLDINMQKKFEEIILAYLEKKKLGRAAGIIMDPLTGEILSLVNIPSYNNNVFARGITFDEYNNLLNQPDKPLFNRVISGEYPSGSTIKPVIAGAALEERVISEGTSVNSVGGLRIGEWFFPDWRAGGHGLTDVRKAIAQSVNTFFYYIGGGYEDFQGLGIDRIDHYAKLFGLGEQTGIDLAGEVTGFLPAKEWKEKVKGERWYIGDTYHIAIGQGDILVTPLQVANYTSVFANGGKLYRPHLVKQILSGDDQFLKEIETEPVRQNFIDSYNLNIVRQGMRQAVTAGSAQSLQAVPVQVAGKTGTAQWSTIKDPHAWFTGWAPYEKPKVVITVLIEEGEEGSDIAVPIAKDFLNWYFGEYTRK